MDPKESLEFTLGRFPLPYGLLVLGFAAVIITFSIVDFTMEWVEEGFAVLELLEIFLILSTAGLLVWIWLQFLKAHRRNVALEEVRRASISRFRADYAGMLRDMRDAVETQFERWGFTRSESQVARLLLQGLPIRNIAGGLNKSPRTVQNQAVSLYAKAGMEGRSDLAAFFLGQLFLDDEPEDAD